MGPATGRPDADAAEFREFVERCHDALRQHTGGNPRPYLELWSHADDVSLMGGVGGHQVGIDEVSALLTAAAKTPALVTGATAHKERITGEDSRRLARLITYSRSLAISTATLAVLKPR